MRELNFINRSTIPSVGLNLDARVFIYILSHPWCVGAILWVKYGLSSVQTYNTSPIASGQAFVVGIQGDWGDWREIVLWSIPWRSWLNKICRQSFCLAIPYFGGSVIKTRTHKLRVLREGNWVNRCTASHVLGSTLQHSACVCLYESDLLSSLGWIQNNLSVFSSRGNDLIILTPCHWRYFTLLMVGESHRRL